MEVSHQMLNLDGRYESPNGDVAMAKKWIQKATKRMKAKGTLGKFGKATAKKIRAGKKKGGLAAKRATFAANMKAIARKRKRRGKTGKSRRKGRR